MELTDQDGQPIPIGTPRRKALLGYLVWRANHVVSTDAVIEALWGGIPPSTAPAQIHSDISALRRTLQGSSCVIQSRPRGYALQIASSDVDYLEFAALVERAKAATDPAESAAGLREALELWRSEAFSDIRAPYVRGARIYMHEQKLHACELLADAELSLGRHFELVAELSALVAEHPLRERLRAQLMIALHRCGRTADALASARELRKLLADQQGLDPGSAIAELEQRLLRAESSLDYPVATVGTGQHAAQPAGTPAPIPAELPAAPASFVGRVKELRQLDGLIREAATATAVTVVAGAPGAGKTTLAVHWGHRRSDRFPDGQLYVNLRGFDPVGVPAAPSEALRGFLLALGIAPQSVPGGVDEQAALYRSLVRGRQILVVLDNARDEQQVRPLLPGSAGAAVLITSRRTLAGLVATSGARIVHLGQLSRGEARELLIGRVGRQRAGAEPQALDALVESCAGLPLALCVAASRAVARPRLALRSLAAELQAPAGELDALASDDIAIDVRTVFAASYRGLSPAAAQVFRMLSLHAGPDIGRAAAASLAGQPPGVVDAALAELVDANLITEPDHHRYACHDLLRAYAAELARSVDAPTERDEAQRRLVDHYVQRAEAAATALNPHRVRVRAAPEPAESLPPKDMAEAWFAAEHRTLLATVGQAAEQQLDESAWDLASAVSTYFDLYGHWHDWIEAGRAAVAAAQRLGDRTRLAHAHHSLAVACNKLGRDADTDAHIDAAVVAYALLDDVAGQAHAFSAKSRILGRRGRHDEALDYGERALELFVACGDLAGQATAHNAVCGSLLDLGRVEPAWHHAGESLRLFQLLGDRRSEADAWDSLGCVHHQRGEYAEAIQCFDHAYELWQVTNDRLGQAIALSRLGDALHALGDPAATTRWESALRLMEELRHPFAVQLRVTLDKFGRAG